MPWDFEGTNLACATKRLWDKNGIKIGTDNVNSILDTIMNELDYQDKYKAYIPTNGVYTNMFAQVDDNGNQCVLFQDIVDHNTDGNK